MALILNIDCSSKTASVSIAEEGLVKLSVTNDTQKDHASFLHTGIKELLSISSARLNDMDAIAVTSGPGSYTGLRVGMATAKGLSYAASKPFICINTLAAMAKALINITANRSEVLFCPLIDARRMEVFTAIYDNEMKEKLSPCAMILEEASFKNELQHNQLIFFGNGSEKLKQIIQHTNALFVAEATIVNSISELSFEKYSNQHFADIIYSEPSYLKDFYSGH